MKERAVGVGWSGLLPRETDLNPEKAGLVKSGLGRRGLSAEGTVWAKFLRREEVR